MEYILKQFAYINSTNVYEYPIISLFLVNFPFPKSVAQTKYPKFGKDKES